MERDSCVLFFQQKHADFHVVVRRDGTVGPVDCGAGFKDAVGGAAAVGDYRIARGSFELAPSLGDLS